MIIGPAVNFDDDTWTWDDLAEYICRRHPTCEIDDFIFLLNKHKRENWTT